MTSSGETTCTCKDFPPTGAYVVITPGVICSPSGGRLAWAPCHQQSGSDQWLGRQGPLLPTERDLLIYQYLCSHYGNDSNLWCDAAWKSEMWVMVLKISQLCFDMNTFKPTELRSGRGRWLRKCFSPFCNRNYILSSNILNVAEHSNTELTQIM